MTWLLGLVADWRTRRRCFHHDHRSGESWIRERIIDYRKRYDCTKCARVWVI